MRGGSRQELSTEVCGRALVIDDDLDYLRYAFRSYVGGSIYVPINRNILLNGYNIVDNASACAVNTASNIFKNAYIFLRSY